MKFRQIILGLTAVLSLLASGYSAAAVGQKMVDINVLDAVAALNAVEQTASNAVTVARRGRNRSRSSGRQPSAAAIAYAKRKAARRAAIANGTYKPAKLKRRGRNRSRSSGRQPSAAAIAYAKRKAARRAAIANGTYKPATKRRGRGRFRTRIR